MSTGIPAQPGVPELRAPTVEYSRAGRHQLLADERVLAVLEFGVATAAGHDHDPRLIPVGLHPWPQGAAAVREVWRADGVVTHGREHHVAWARSPDWMMMSLRLADDGGDLRTLGRVAYAELVRFLAAHPDFHVQRLWNYLDRINCGRGDAERYRRFCLGRLEGMGRYFDNGFPAATGIGHTEAAGVLQVYGLAARQPGKRVENPRQLSAWRYPRQYGPASPSFARAMRMPAGGALAVSGTAAIQGHRSRHAVDLQAQFDETRLNLQALIAAAGKQAPFGARSPLKVYVRHAHDMQEVGALMDRHFPHVPRLLLQADICRRELLLEIDGWHFD